MKTTVLTFIISIFVLSLQAQWQKMPGTARDIGVGAEGSVWVIGTGQVGASDFTIHRLNGTTWNQLSGGAVRIDVDPTGNAWVVNSSGQIYRWERNAWNQVEGTASDIGIGSNGHVWIIGKTATEGGFNIQRRRGSTWENIPGGALRIDVDHNGNAWVVNSYGNIFRWHNNSWLRVEGRGREIGICPEGNVYLVGWDAHGAGYRVFSGAANRPFSATDGGLVQVSGGPGGRIYGIDNANNIWRFGSGDALPEAPANTRMMTRFDPAVHGFKFVNNFTVPTQFAGINGPTFGGLCGGMVYAALDYFYARMPVPAQDYMPAERTTLQSYLYSRQMNSVERNLDKWAEYGFNPGGARNREFFTWGVEFGGGRLGELMRKIDAGDPVPLGLQSCGNDCGCNDPAGCMGSHQILAIGYDLGRYRGNTNNYAGDVQIFVYDPNYPGRTMILRPNVGGAMWYYENRPRDKWRAYFTDMKYTRSTPPAIPANASELVATFITGGDDLRGGGDQVNLVLILNDGSTLRFDRLNGGARWADGSSQSVARSLPAGFNPSTINSVRLETNFKGGFGGENWNLQEFFLEIKQNNSTTSLVSQSGTPLVRFTGERKVWEYRIR